MQEAFHYSAIEEIVDVLDVPIGGHNIYAYRLKELTGGYRDTLNLIEYILCENFNTAWDKNVWDDVACFGYVRDLADWFASDRFEHKLGTIYALLTAIRKSDKYLYELVVREMTGLEQLGDHHIIYIAAKIVEKFAPTSTSHLDTSSPGEGLYTALWEALYSGKACCHLESEEDWLHVRESLMRRIPENVSLAKQDLLYHKMTVGRIS